MTGFSDLQTHIHGITWLFSSRFFDMAPRFWIAAAAVMMEMILGRIGVLPVRLSLVLPFTRLARWLEKRLNRKNRSARTRLVRGGLVMVVMLILAALGAIDTVFLAGQLSHPHILDLVFLVLCLSPGRRWRAAGRVARVLQRKAREKNQDIDAGHKSDLKHVLRRAKRHIGYYTRRDMGRLDEYALCRMAIEVLARAVDRGLLAPIIWYLVFGTTGLWYLAAIMGLARAVGNLGPHIADFGLVAARAEDIMVLVPLWQGVIFWIVLIPFAWPDRRKAVLALLRKKSSPALMSHADVMLGSYVAGVLDIALYGPRSEAGQVVQASWIGTGTAKAQPRHIAITQWMLAMQICFWLMVLILLGIAGFPAA